MDLKQQVSRLPFEKLQPHSFLIAAAFSVESFGLLQDFWASLEHEIKYKKELPDSEKIAEELRECADVIASTDRRMLHIRNHIHQNSPEETFDPFEKSPDGQ